ncbi:hypothetical protein M8J75_009440 [Diaphorina citri]|nr:hypothetical protein M8J75_009440 [Diaphorina citri]KAI5731766.1 hypothetical protein M8J77_015632 [Diaphorina citri]
MEQCPQCKGLVVCSESRLVQDSCGHIKCRMCLLSDSTQCYLCWQKNEHASFIIEAPESDKDEKFTIPDYIQVIPGEPVMYKCLKCKRQFKVKYNCKYHIHCTSLKAKLSCDICDKTFVNKSHLDYHKLSHQDLNPYECSNCHKGFKNKGKLNRHMKIHSDSKEQWFCKVCNKALMSVESLKKHMKIHAGLKNYHCDICEKSFIEKNDLIKHQVTHSDKKIFVCENCGKSFKRKYDLALHIRTHFPLKRFQCKLCDKIFFTLHNMRRHMRIHKDRPLFECHDCHKSFTRKDNLERHVKSIHLEDPSENTNTINGHLAIEPKESKIIGILAIEPKKSIDEIVANELKQSSSNGLLPIEPAPKPSYQNCVRNGSPEKVQVPFNNKVSVIQRVPVIMRATNQGNKNISPKSNKINDSIFKQPFPVKALNGLNFK